MTTSSALLHVFFQGINHDFNPKLNTEDEMLCLSHKKHRTLAGLLSSEMVRPVMDHMFQIDYIFPQRPTFLYSKSQFVPLERSKPNFQLKLSFFNGLFSYCSEWPYPASLEELLIVTSSYLNSLLEARSWNGTISFGFASLAPALLIYFYAERDRALAPFHREGSPEEPDSRSRTMNQSITVQ